MNKNRVTELITHMKSFEKENYQKSELLEEMLSLQQEIVNITFNDEHADKAGLRLYDVVKHLEQLNDERNHIADDEIRRFSAESKKLANLIKAEISGKRGETIAFRSLDNIKTAHKVLKNVELEDETTRTELDAVVIGTNGITIVEVKNTSRDIFIDENGNYYRTGEFLSFDCNIAEKMQVREQLLEKKLMYAGLSNIEIQSVLVFTNNRIEVQNKCSSIKTCFAGQLSYIASDWRIGKSYSEDEMEIIQKAIEKLECKRSYSADIDINQFKLDFATAMATLEGYEEAEVGMETNIVELERNMDIGSTEVAYGTAIPFERIKSLTNSSFFKYTVGIATGFTLGLISSYMALSKNNRR